MLGGTSALFKSTLARFGLLPWLRVRNGTAHLMLPEWLYDLLVFVFFPVNWILSALPSRVPFPCNRRDWPLDPELVPAKLPAPGTSLEAMTAVIRRRDTSPLADAEIWSLFDALATPSTNDLIGTWRGKVVNTGNWLNLPDYGLGRPLRWFGCDWGKRFFTPYRGDPLIFILWNSIVVPVPLWGSVSMPAVEFRGKSGATMAYDHQPWRDHFRLLDDGKVSGRKMMLGNWMSREKLGGWFTLEEMPQMDEATRDLLVKSPY